MTSTKIAKSILILFLFSLMFSFVSASNINGWGGDQFFGYQQQYTSFKSTFSDTYNSTIATGTLNKPVVCNIDTSTNENELIFYSGTNVYLYSGRGFTMSLIDTYTATSNINDIGCFGNVLHVGTTSTYERVKYNGTSLYNDGTSTSVEVHDIDCDYTNQVCAVLYEHRIIIYDENGDSLYSSGIGITNLTYNFGDGGDKIKYHNNGLATVLDVSNGNFKTYNLTTTANPQLLYSSSLSDLGDGEAIGFVDFSNDGIWEVCHSWQSDGVTDYNYMKCYDYDLGLIGSQQTMGTTGVTGGAPFVVPLNINGVTTMCGGMTSGAGNDFRCYDAPNDNLYNYDTIYIPHSSLFGYFNNENEFEHIRTGDIYNYSENKVYDSGKDYGFVADLTGDTDGEFIFYDDTGFLVFFDEPIDVSLLTPTITFSNNGIYGGFYGYYTGDICSGTNITFQALECIGDLEQCTYYNSDSSEQERLKTNCGTGSTDYYGGYSNVNPSVTCEYSAEGDYEVIIYIQDSDGLNSTNNENVPIPIHVEDSASCNLGSELLSQPYINENVAGGDSGEGTAPDVNATTTTTTTTSNSEQVTNNLRENIMLVIGLSMVIGLISFLYFSGVRSPFILSASGILMLIITNVLGLISFLTTVFIVIAFIVIGLVVGIAFKPARMG